MVCGRRGFEPKAAKKTKGLSRARMPGPNGRRDAARGVIIAHNWLNWLRGFFGFDGGMRTVFYFFSHFFALFRTFPLAGPFQGSTVQSPQSTVHSPRSTVHSPGPRAQSSGSTAHGDPLSGLFPGLFFAPGRRHRRGGRTADARLMGTLYHYATQLSRGHFIFLLWAGGLRCPGG